MDVLDQTDKPYYGRSLESVLTEGYNFQLGDYLSKAFKLFGKDAGSYIGYTLVSFIIQMVVGLIPFIGSLAGIVLGPALTGGWFIYAEKHDHGKPKTFSNFFDGFKNPPWVQLILGNLVVSIFIGFIAMIILIPAVGFGFLQEIVSMSNITNPEEIQEMVGYIFAGKLLFIFFLVAIIVMIIYALFSLTPMFIIFRGMGFWEAMGASRKVVMKRLPQFIVLFIVLSVLVVIGAALCGLGLLVAVPVAYLTMYCVFDDIMGAGEPAQQ